MANFLVLLAVSTVVTVCAGSNLQLGTSINNQIAYVEEVKLAAIPFTVRTKNVFFNDEKNPNLVIKGISAIDVLNSDAKATVTAGGIGSSFVNIRMKSLRGEGLHYQVQIFI